MNNKYPQNYTNGTDRKTLKIDIVGAGLVGSLAALHLAKKGHDVHLFEYREDIRKSALVQGRSINLALSARGRAALAEVGLEEKLLEHGIPMRGRMLHDLLGNTKFIPYDAVRNECIYSVGRKHLNEILLTTGEKYSNIHRYFNHKLISANFDEGQLHFKKMHTNEDFKSYSDLIVGCDGAYSAVRRCMMTRPSFNFSQTYIEHGYLELCIPPVKGEFAMPPNYLHIWPRGKFMMIALPNQDKTWTVTLFMPFENFNSIKNRDDLLEFFEKYFPDSINLIGIERLIKDFFKTKAQHLVSIKCYPYNVDSQALLLGDAAHAMVPFFGQGMNAGFEDCSLLSEFMNQEINMDKVLNKFSETRWENAHAMCDLAMYNYIEMRDLVTRKSFQLRKILDNLLFRLMPTLWLPLYNSVSFTRTPYKQCLENRRWQDRILRNTGIIIFGISLTTGILIYWKKNVL